MRLAGKAVRVESFWKRGKTVDPGLPEVHRRGEESRKAAGVVGVKKEERVSL